jgi:hypothetical protein
MAMASATISISKIIASCISELAEVLPRSPAEPTLISTATDSCASGESPVSVIIARVIAPPRLISADVIIKKTQRAYGKAGKPALLCALEVAAATEVPRGEACFVLGELARHAVISAVLVESVTATTPLSVALRPSRDAGVFNAWVDVPSDAPSGAYIKCTAIRIAGEPCDTSCLSDANDVVVSSGLAAPLVIPRLCSTSCHLTPAVGTDGTLYVPQVGYADTWLFCCAWPWEYSGPPFLLRLLYTPYVLVSTERRLLGVRYSRLLLPRWCGYAPWYDCRTDGARREFLRYCGCCMQRAWCQRPCHW